MTIFLDGPAANTFSTPLMLKRAPHYLRAVQAMDGTWDALDQLHDEPAPGERIFAYEMVGNPSRVHICARGRNAKHGGFYEGGQYKLCDPQPTDAQLRDTAAWRFWCAERIGKPIAADGTVAS